MTHVNQNKADNSNLHSNGGLHLMSLVPNPSFTTTYHTLDMSIELHDALIDLLDDRGNAYNLNTKTLKTQLMQYLDQPVQMQPISRRRNTPIPNWLMTNAPIELPRLRAIIINWVGSICQKEKFGGQQYCRVLELIEPSALNEHVHSEHFTLFDESLRPAGSHTFDGLAISVCEKIDGKTCRLSCGTNLVFERMLGSTKSRSELLSQIIWHNGFPYAIRLSLSTQTVPPRCETRLNVKVSVCRFAQGTWAFARGGRPYLKNDAVALVRWAGARWCRASYGYDARRKTIEWDGASRRNLRDIAGIELPDLSDYLSHMDSWAQCEHELQILTPQSPAATWQNAHKVAVGLTINDKAEIFDFVTSCLTGIASPAPDPIRVTRRNMIKHVSEKSLETDKERQAWVRENRHRLRVAVGKDRIELEFIGTQAERAELAAARKEAIEFLGPEGDADGIHIGMTTRILDDLLTALPSSSVASACERMDKIRKTLDDTGGIPTACIVVLPNYSLDKELAGRDPKQAIRLGLALSGRLSQFLVPRGKGSGFGQDNASACERNEGKQNRRIETPALEQTGEPDTQDDTFDRRVSAAMRDLMRQLGFVHKFKDAPALKLTAPMYGIHLVASSAPSHKQKDVLIATKVNYSTGATEALLPQLQTGWIPYWKAQIELARMSNPLHAQKADNADGNMLKSLIEELRKEAPQDALLLVHSYGCIRRKEWWPGISDENIARGQLYYGPTIVKRNGSASKIDDLPFNREATKLNILRIRLGDSDKVPDYYTDLTGGLDGEDKIPTRACKQGIFRADGYLLALVPRPGDKQYRSAHCGSKLNHPSTLVHAKSLSEYVLLTSDDEDLALQCVHRAEASRAGMVQLLKSDMKVNLPAPLHLAEKMEEYIWDPKG